METQKSWPAVLLVVAVIFGCALSACFAGAVVGGLVGSTIGYSAGEKRASVVRTPPREISPEPEYPWPETPQRPPSIYERRPAALVITVEPASPAEEADLRPGDLIIAVDDEEISQDRDLAAIVQDYEPGDRVRLTFLREGREERVRIRLGRRRTEDGQIVAFLGLTYQLLPAIPLPAP